MAERSFRSRWVRFFSTQSGGVALATVLVLAVVLVGVVLLVLLGHG
jgi:ABC-type uncharacterized transport system permease subunit